MMLKRTLVICFSIILMISVYSCKKVDSTDNNTIYIVTTTGMVADLAKNIGLEKVTVKGLMGPGVDPHLYRATEGDVTKLTKAKIIFYNGLHLESKMGEILEKLNGRIKTVAVAGDIDQSALIELEAGHDPHIWFDVSLWIEAAKVIRDTLVEYDSANKDYYEANAANYIIKLEELHKYVQQRALEVPEKKRVLITAHDAFSYFGRAYNFRVMGLQGISTVSEAGTKDVQTLAQFIAANEIPVIFIESSVPVKNIEALQEAVRAKGYEVTIGGELFSDAMGVEGTVEGTYLGMVRHNIDTIVDAFIKGQGE